MSTAFTATHERPTARGNAPQRTRGAQTGLNAWSEIIALILITAALIAATLTTSGIAHSSTPSERIRVDSGQTLWTLARQHPVAGLTTERTAELIASANHIKGGRLRAGATIRIPKQVDHRLELACR